MSENGRKRDRSGAEKRKAVGKMAIMIAVSPETKSLLQRAAKAQGRSLASFVAYHAIMSATAVVGGALFPDAPLKGEQ